MYPVDTTGLERVNRLRRRFDELCVTVDEAVEGSHQTVMFNMGQVCCAGSRTYVHESIYDEFVKRSVERAKKRTTGDPFKTENENGPQVTRQNSTLG